MRICIDEPVREDSFSPTGAALTGVLLSFRSGACYAFSRYVFFGLEFYLSGIYTAGEDAGRPIFQNRGGAIGRMPIAPVFMGAAQELFFGETWRGLLLEREAVAGQSRLPKIALPVVRDGQSPRFGHQATGILCAEMTKRGTVVYCSVIRLTRREQLFILALFFAIFIGAVAKHYRDGGPRIPAPLESTE
jgi:hypothetical protein